MAIQFVGVSADYDDGYIAWINGVEVYRSPEMPAAGDPAWNEVPHPQRESSNGSVPDYGPTIEVTGVAPLQAGTNVLAVGIWNSGAGSSDLVLVPRLGLATTTDNCPSLPNPSVVTSALS